MILLLSPDVPPVLSDVERLDRLHAESPGPLAEMMTGSLCRFDDDGAHVWLDIAVARAAGVEAACERGDDDEWPGNYDAMIAYAASKGWTDGGGTHVRAHVEQVAGSG